MYRVSHFRGAAIMGAISAIDIALWDIAGKNFGIRKYPLDEHEPPKSEIVNRPLELDAGFLRIPDAPGIGIEILDDAPNRFPATKRPVGQGFM